MIFGFTKDFAYFLNFRLNIGMREYNNDDYDYEDEKTTKSPNKF